MKTLTIKLTAPLQSYGSEATFERRTSSDYPTKSAVIGMVAAALGYRRTDQRILMLNNLDFAVRIDQIGTNLTDFQTVEIKKNVRKVTYRDYLQDAVFVVALGSTNDQLIDTIKVALQHPRFALFLGRRANVPAGVLQLTEFAGKAPVAVLKQFSWQAKAWYQRRHRHDQTLEIVADAHLIAATSSAMVKDRVVSFNERDRRYGFRAISKTKVKLSDLDVSIDKPETHHDIMSQL